MHRYSHKTIVFLLLFFCRPLLAQEFSHEVLNAANGLPTSEILSLFKDSKGFLWAGTTQGVSKYDGYSFENFQTAVDGHFVGNVMSVCEDKQKIIWVGSHAGLFYLENNLLYKATLPDSAGQGVNDILVEDNGNIWLATEAGPAYINNTALKNCKTQPINLAKHILPQWIDMNLSGQGRRVTKVKKAADGTVFFGSFNDVYRFEKNQLNRLFHRKETESHFVILNIYPIDRNRVYFNESKKGLHKIVNDTVIFIPNRYPSATGSILKTPYFWYLDAGGFYKFHPEEEVVSFSFNTFSLDITWLSDILNDESGFFWAATHDGLIKIKPSPFKKYPTNTFANVREVYSFTETYDGKLLLGTNRGKIFQKVADSFQHFFTNRQGIVPLAEIFDIHEDHRRWLWFGTGYQGLAVYRREKLKRFMMNDGLHDNSIRVFFRSSKNKLYAIGDFGATEIIVDSNENISFRALRSKARMSQYGSHFGAVEAPDNSIWLGGEEGLFFIRGDSLISYQLDHKHFNIRDIKKDKAGQVWIATSGEGLLHCRFNEDGQLIIVKKYSEKDGLNTSTFLTLLFTSDGNTWAGSPRGISFIGLNGPNKNKVLNFEEKDGFIKSGYSNLTLYQDRKAVIWAGASTGLTSFHPISIYVNELGPSIYVTSVGLLNSKASINSYTDTLVDNLPLNLSLPYNENSLQFSYTSVDFVNSSALRYYYQLNSFDTGWIYAKGERTVSYRNLPPGKYQFKVKSINDKNLSSKSEASFEFVINPPFWLRWWFIMISIVAIVITVYLLYRMLRQKYETQKTLNRFITALYGKNTPEDIFRSIADNCIQQLHFEDCVVYQSEREGNILVQKAAAGPKSPLGHEIINAIEIEVGKGIVGSVAKFGKSEIVSNTQKDSRYIVDDMRRMSELSVPIIVEGKVFAVIDAEHPKMHFFKKHHLSILESIAAICATRISLYINEEKLRTKIARDLHDDMGSTLSSININSKMALQNMGSKSNSQEYLLKIKDNSGRMLESMSDIVWAINPANDTIEKVNLRMKEFAAEMLEPLNIGYNFKEIGDFNNTVLNLDQRKDFYLIYKEAINNAAKYSKCTRVDIEISKTEQFIVLSVKDNGIGFDTNKIRLGNGLLNMQARARLMNARFSIDTEPGTGVGIVLMVPMIP